MPTRLTARAALALILLAAASAGCRHPAPLFSESNARAHVNTLAGSIGSRPAGTDANRRAREYVSDQLRFYGFTVRVQEADAVWPAAGVSARVANVIGILPGRQPEAIGLVAHYDSRPETPGAGDDATGVAVVLETARLLAAGGPRRYTVMALLTDAEEDGLLGARALVADPEVRSRLRAFVNVEAAGSDAPAILFQAGPGNGWLVRTWAGAAPSPRGSSYYSEIYRRLPNDTDFTVLAQAGIPGLNFAAVGDGYAYHAAGDGPDRVTRELLVHMGENVLATVQALDRVDITVRTNDQPVYFDLAGRRAVVLSPLASRAISIAAIVLGLVAIVRAARVVARLAGRAAAWRAAGWGIVTAAATGGAPVAICAVLRAVREVYHPWYAHPTRLWICLGLTIALVVTIVARVARRSPAWLQVPAHPATVWTAVLAPWICLTLVTEALAPSAAYLWSLPLAAAGLLVALLPAARGVPGSLAATTILVVSACTWLPHAVTLLQFAVPTFGRLPLVTPVAVYPAICVATAIAIVPPLVALLASVIRPIPLARSRGGRALDALVVSSLAVGVAASFASAYLAEAYTFERPLVRTALYVADHVKNGAAWETGANEPGLPMLTFHAGMRPGDLPAPVFDWRPADSTAPPVPGLPIPPLPMPFRFRAPADVAAAPADASGRWLAGDGRLDVEITVQLRQDRLLAAVLLPPGTTPIGAAPPGEFQRGWWTTARAAAPSGPVTFRLTLPRGAEAALPEVRVVVVAPGAAPPGAAAPAGPSREVWRGRAVHSVAVAWTPSLR